MILKIAGNKISNFNTVNVNLVYDSVASTFSFDYRFDPNDQELVVLNKISAFQRCTVEHNGQILITGTVLNNGFPDSSTKQLTGISGYSITGVLEDCEIPPDLYPLQSNGKSLKQIAEKLIKPFGLQLIVDPAVSSGADRAFDVSVADASDRIKGYLAKIAAQKHMILSHDSAGNLLLTKAKTGSAPIYDFVRGQDPVTNMVLTVDGQRMHSEITVIKQADSDGGNAGQHTVKNPFVSVYRPHVRIQSSGTDNDTNSAAKSALAEELSAISIEITLSTWELNGAVIRPNTVVSVINSELNLKKSLWFVESVSFTGNESSQVATLKCVIPEVHNGETPKNIFS